MYEGGLENMRYSVSDTAQWGTSYQGHALLLKIRRKRWVQY